MINEDSFSKIEILEALQSKELRIYQNFLDTLQRQMRILFPNVDKLEVLNEMMLAKKNMMEEITVIEQELSPIRKEISNMVSEGNLNIERVDIIKNKDIQIIETISQISKAEQELTHRIQERMSEIGGRLRDIGNTKKINKQYGSNHISFKEGKKNSSGGYHLDFSG